MDFIKKNWIFIIAIIILLVAGYFLVFRKMMQKQKGVSEIIYAIEKKISEL